MIWMKRDTHEDLKSAQAAFLYHSTVPQAIKKTITEVEKELWVELKETQQVDAMAALYKWIQNSGTNCSLLALYDCLMALFWVMKGMSNCVLLDIKEKEKGDKELVKCWKEHYTDSRLMQKKIDVISK